MTALVATRPLKAVRAEEKEDEEEEEEEEEDDDDDDDEENNKNKKNKQDPLNYRKMAFGGYNQTLPKVLFGKGAQLVHGATPNPRFLQKSTGFRR